jgi:hypothetical protein
MKKITAVGLVILLATLSTTLIFAADTAGVLGGGVCINEVLIDPNGTYSFDTDSNGTADTLDEFVELYNLSGSDIDISGWQLWDDGVGNWFTFPGSVDGGTIVLSAGAYAVVVCGVQAGGTLPVMTNPNSLIFDAGRTTGVITNLGDNIVLHDPGADEYIQLLFNADGVDIPEVDYVGDGFSATATRVGSIEDFGSDTDGKSLTRYPAGDTAVYVHDAIPGVTAFASPTVLTLRALHASENYSLWAAVVAFCLVFGSIILGKPRA